MNPLQQTGIRTARLDEFALFLLGLFSTWQIVQVAGFAVFTPLLLAVMLYFCLSRKPRLRRDWLLFAMLILYSITTVLAMTHDTARGYKTTAISNFVQWAAVLVVCQYAGQSDKMDGTGAFLRGFDWSCRVQIAWCFLQFILYKGFGLDLNHEIFAKIFGFVGKAGHYRGDVLVSSGLHWHAANMVPVLVFTFFRSKNIAVKVLCVVTAYLTKVATVYIGVMLCVGCELMVVIKRALIDQNGNIKRKNAIIGLAVLGAGVLVGGVAWPKIQDVLTYLWGRLLEVANPMPGNESSATHLTYYTKLPYVLTHIPGIQILFGTGMNTSGHYFGQFFNQYRDVVWVLESDFSNELLSTGVLGVVVHYLFILAVVLRMHRADKQSREYWALLVLVVCGIFYNNQFIWVLLVETMYYAHARKMRRLNRAAQEITT